MALEVSHTTIITALDEAAIGLTRGGNLFAGPMRPGKTLTAFVAGTGGTSPDLLSGGAQLEMATAQVSVWSPIDNAEAGFTLALTALRTLHRREIGGYYMVLARETEPHPIGRDDAGRTGYAFNVELHGLRR